MKESSTENNTKKSLKYSIYDGAAVALMDGLTSSFIAPFAIALNSSVNLIAALTYVPKLFGAFVQLFAFKTLELFRDRVKIIWISSLLHSILWIPLLLIPFLTPSQKYLLVVYITIQEILAELINPIWNSLMGDLVPKYERGRFFGFRNRIVGIFSFLGAISAGVILNYTSTRNPFVGFAVLFFVAFVSRALSSVFKAMMHNPPINIQLSEKFSIFDFVKRMDKTNYGRFVIYIALFKFAVNISSPFFVVYMLKNLGFSYAQFTIITAAELVSSFITLGIWGKAIDNKGTKFVLYFTGMLTPFIPLLWLTSKNYYYLVIVQTFAGIAWAGFNLSASNFIFDSVKPENRVRCISYFKFFESTSTFLGAASGGFIISKAPSWFYISGIPLVFLISGILRLIISIFLLPSLREARLIKLGITHGFFKRYITIRPSEGIVYEIIGKFKKPKSDLMKKSEQNPTIKKDNIELGKYKKLLYKLIIKRENENIECNKNSDSGIGNIEHLTEDIIKGKNRIKKE